jgi:hypothetical protein
MDLLIDANIQIDFDSRSGQWEATVNVDNSITHASAVWPELAIGRAVIQHVDMTEGKLKTALEK